MKTSLHPLLAGLVAGTATLCALALSACGPESSQLDQAERNSVTPAVEVVPGPERKTPVPTLQPAPPVQAQAQATAPATA